LLGFATLAEDDTSGYSAEERLVAVFGCVKKNAGQTMNQVMAPFQQRFWEVACTQTNSSRVL
jgi:hypothetical protein